ncbi:hypothetical protein AVEN_188693-1 [Araneus ventricosus]|uniref:Uncharacterized protein n=1 Tax=Araneus ventricosus TaxID=182803 RepID=A0A4Y2D954_ARAVE|nr:hypothetical protein AVEN_188693-1 [Araneus ventricosus]
MIWAGVSLGGHTDLHVLYGGTLTAVKYRDEILDPYARLYAGDIGEKFIPIDDSRPQRTRLVEEYLEDQDLERMDSPA